MSLRMRRFRFFAVVFGILSLYYTLKQVTKAGAEELGSSQARPLVTLPVRDSQLVTLKGNTRPEVRTMADQGAVADSLTMPHLWLQLKRSPEQQQALDSLVEQLHTTGSTFYHQWLTPAEFGATFGVASGDLAKVTAWLQAHGMTVNQVYANGTLIDFTATAGQVREAFHTEVHTFRSATGETHFANVSDPQIPAALAPVVAGIVRLHSFAPKPLSVARGAAKLDKSTGKATPLAAAKAASSGVKADFSTTCPSSDCGYAQTLNIVAPADFATIYNVNPLLNASTPINGTGQTIVTLEDSDMQAADFASFRSAFLPSSATGTLTLSHPGGPNTCTDPGKSEDEVEAAIDAEWAGAVAPNAKIISASCSSTNVAFGGLIALENLLNSAGSPAIYSLSFGECESNLGYAENAAFNATYQQAAAQGASVFVASGNAAADACDGDDATQATLGLAVNGYASTPYNVAVGGTDFSDTYSGTTSTYWSTTDGANYLSAKSYIPEVPWDDSCANQLNYSYQGYASGENFCNSTEGERSFLTNSASGGGASQLYSKPSYQAGFSGVQADGLRDLPDVSLFSSGGIWGHSLAYCMSDTSEGGVECGYADTQQLIFNLGGGTAFSTAAMAGIQALVNQKTGEVQGNPNYALYGLAKASYGTGGSAACNASQGNAVSSSCVFHDVTLGDNSVPCLAGTSNCLLQSTEHNYGVLSADGSTPAYQATTGWDFATGIGTPNVANLVNAWAAASAGAPAMTVVINPNSVVQGGTITATATVSGSGSYPTGTIKISASGSAGTLGSVTLPVVPTTAPACAATCSNSVNFTYTLPKTLALGTYTVTASYTPTSGQYKAATATTEFYIASNTTSTTLGSLAYNGGGANAVTSTVSYSGSATPTGSINLLATDTLTKAVQSLGSFPVSGNGSACTAAAGLLTCQLNYQPPFGSFSVVAVYSGDANYVSSTSPAVALNDVQQPQAAPTLSIAPATVTPGNPTPTFTVIVTGALVTQYAYPEVPTGTITLSGDNGLGTFLSIPTTACRTYPTNSAAVPPQIQCVLSYNNMWGLWGNGTYHIVATYNGTGYFQDAVVSSAAQTLTISTGAASSTVISISGNGNYAVGSKVTATLVSTGVAGKGAPTGTVTLSPTGLGFPLSFNLPTVPGVCTATNSYTTTCVYTFTIPANAQPGPYTVVASYAGDANYNPSTSSVPLFVLPSISLTAGDHDFGSVATGQKASFGVRVTNNMSVAFAWNPGLIGSSEFTMQNGCGTSIPAGASCEMTFGFDPTALGTQTATWAASAGPGITYWPSDGGTLSGTGIAGESVTLSTDGHNFGTQAIGSVSQVYGTVLTNGLQDPVAITITVSGDTADFTTYATNCGTGLAANQSCNLQYQFTPQAKGTEQEVVAITVTDTVTHSAVTLTSGGVAVNGITLTGTGQ